MQATEKAVRSALDQLPPGSIPPGDALPPFTQIWSAYAGCARPPDFAILQPPLERLFPDSPVRLTSDAELLSSPALHSPAQRCINLICGTGSLALLWEKRDGQLQQSARSGGWGPLLGDEGSGWSLGREGVKSLLSASANGSPLRPWQEEILKAFGVKDEPQALIRVSSILDTGLPHGEADRVRRGRISHCSRMVISGAESGDDLALQAVDKVAMEVIEVLRPLVKRLDQDERDTMLVVAGGLGQVDLFWSRVVEEMEKLGWMWYEVVKMAEPALEGVKLLAQNLPS